jgi:hypothetical protein
MILKIMGLGFYFDKDAYIKDSWNILDFVIVMSGYVTLIFESGPDESLEDISQPGNFDQSGPAVDLAGVRVFRVMRPLKTITSIKGLKVLV